MRFHLLPLALATAAAVAGCGGSDVGAPQAPQPVVSSARRAPVVQSAPASFVVRVGEGADAQRFVVKMSRPEAIATARQELSGGLRSRPVLVGELREGDGGSTSIPPRAAPGAGT